MAKPEVYNSKKNPYIAALFDASTAHITKKDDDLLRDTEMINPYLISYPYEEGYFVYVPEEINTEVVAAQTESRGYSKNLITLLQRAQEQECIFLRLDCDGVEYEDLPTFDW